MPDDASRNLSSLGMISGAAVERALRRDLAATIPVIEGAYRAHGAGETTNLPSLFLRFPDHPEARIIALAADVRAGVDASGLKWIASYPGNVDAGLPRASAVLVLNRRDTGRPFVLMEASLISAARTAASAALGAERLCRSRKRAEAIGFVGCGLIARYVLDMMLAAGWKLGAVGAHDLRAERADRFLGHVASVHAGPRWRAGTPAELIERCDIVVFATTAGEPYLGDPGLFAHRPLVLHLSLRDLGPEVILSANNVVDDVDHCLKAGTSPHLAEQRTGRRDFVNGTIVDALGDRLELDPDKPTIFTPFGMGILDVALGKHVYDQVKRTGELVEIEIFFVDPYPERL